MVTPARVQSLQVAGLIITNFVNFKVVGISSTSAGGTRYATARALGGTAGYQVPGGDQFRIVAARITGDSNPDWGIGYGDTDVGFNSASAPTTPVYIFGTSDAVFYSTTAGGPSEVAFAEPEDTTGGFIVPASKYPFIVENAGTAFAGFLFGYEETP